MRENLSDQVPALVGWTRESHINSANRLLVAQLKISEGNEKLEVQVKARNQVPLILTVKYICILNCIN